MPPPPPPLSRRAAVLISLADLDDLLDIPACHQIFGVQLDTATGSLEVVVDGPDMPVYDPTHPLVRLILPLRKKPFWAALLHDEDEENDP